MDKKYEWLTLTVADEGYSMEILDGNFYNNSDKCIATIPSNQVLQSQWWDGDSGIAVTGDQSREVPSKMTIKWFSYAENKFYQGNFKLDHEKISALFKEGLKCNGNLQNYNYIKVAIAPGGQVFLYLDGGNTVFIGSYVAKEDLSLQWIDLGNHTNEARKEDVNHYQSDMPLQTQKEIEEHKINTTIWNDINKRYPWKYTLEAQEFEHLPLTMQDDKKGANYISGEKAWCTDTGYFTKPSLKPIPLEVDGVFKTSAGRTFTIRIYPGNVGGKEARYQSYEIRRAREQELVKLFKDFYEKTGKEEFEIHLRMDDHFKTGKVFLKKGKLEQEIPNTEVQIFDDTFGE